MRKLLWLTACTLAMGAAQAAEPAAKTFELAINGGSVAKEQRLIRVDKGAAVKLRISSDAAGDLHLHPYKIETHVAPGAPAEVSFTAHATGRFRFSWHPANAPATSGGDHHSAPLATLEVMPK